ncbi:MAG: quinone-dependent dihydroorotate dehydrogenase [Crocinitomicaceae bacterium]|nr:quinone-dependent dihydroorotate dehydrogenase [Crocinitomicaceae bacterium]
MYKIIRFFLFQFDPEKIHYFTAKLIRITLSIPGMKWIWSKRYCIQDETLERELFGLKFSNPVGLAAGFDKNATMFNDLAYCGFGFIEIGTVTPKGQDGNPKPRLFRIKEDSGLINRMGFNNAGLAEAVEALKKNKRKVIIGGNIGKNTNTSPDGYTSDYLECFAELHPYVDYFVLNVSCPNVSSHAKLEDVDYLRELISEVQRVNASKEIQRPVLLKIAPDLNNQQLDEIIDLVAQTTIDGVIAANTSVNRSELKTSESRLEEIGNGGLSGKPVTAKSTRVIKYLSSHSNKAFPIIGVGGIHSEKDALEKIEAGADLVQIYTGFIYEGPGLIKRINKAILAKSK